MFSSRLARAAIAGVTVGAMSAIGLLVTSESHQQSVEGTVAAEAFLESWDRYRRSTFRMVGETTRTNLRGEEMVWPTEVVQRPPDVLRFGPEGFSGQVGSASVNCVTAEGAGRLCGGQESLADFESEVSEELAILRGYFLSEPSPLYRVTHRSDGCFELSLFGYIPEPPYGDRAEFCFDDLTGALVFAEMDKGDVIDRLVADLVYEVVTDADFVTS